MPRTRTLSACLLALALLVPHALAQTPATPPTTAPATPRPERKPQPRPHGARVVVPADKVRVDDGDTIDIRWGENDRETVRILGIDTPETRHVEHDLPYAQSFGYEARSFGLGAFAVASKIEVLRSDTLDPYGRTLGYVFLDGRNYSVLVVRARLAEESISRYGDNGFPKEAAEVLAAAKAAGPLPFESPGDFRRRMRDVSRAMKERGEHAP